MKLKLRAISIFHGLLKIQTLQKYQILKVTDSDFNAKLNTFGRLSDKYNDNRHNWHDQHTAI
jgi:hypothetical protein